MKYPNRNKTYRPCISHTNHHTRWNAVQWNPSQRNNKNLKSQILNYNFTSIQSNPIQSNPIQSNPIQSNLIVQSHEIIEFLSILFFFFSSLFAYLCACLSSQFRSFVFFPFKCRSCPRTGPTGSWHWSWRHHWPRLSLSGSLCQLLSCLFLHPQCSRSLLSWPSLFILSPLASFSRPN